MYIQESVESKPKLRLYKCVLSQTPKDYLFSHDRTTRVLLASLLSGCLKLRVETGRFQNERIEERLCVFCEQNKTEDEIHFLLDCDMYKNVRKVMFESIPLENSNDKVNVFCDLILNFSRQTAPFVRDMWKLRCNKLYKKNDE